MPYVPSATLLKPAFCYIWSIENALSQHDTLSTSRMVNGYIALGESVGFRGFSGQPASIEGSEFSVQVEFFRTAII